MQTLVCIDDTDILGSRGTGHLAAQLIEDIEQQGWGNCTFISRHQLHVHPDIPYTSHNSAMCFTVKLQPECLKELIDYAADFLIKESEIGSDPGLCVVVPERIKQPERLMAFGRRAKREVLSKDYAYSLAQELGIHLSEHGGTGQGVIGALAGVGLRLTGNDGRIRGKIYQTQAGEILTVAQLLSHPQVDLVRQLDGGPVQDKETVRLGEKVKTVLLDHCRVLLVATEDPKASGAKWRTCVKEELRRF
ncbi:MAG: hypothetical protein ACOYEO_02050 [bacterium]|jgi:hypothetical protein